MRRRILKRWYWIGLGILAGILQMGVACGKKGPPLPPLPSAPPVVQDWGIRCIDAQCVLWIQFGIPPNAREVRVRPPRWILILEQDTPVPQRIRTGPLTWRADRPPYGVRPGHRWMVQLPEVWPQCVRLVVIPKSHTPSYTSDPVCRPADIPQPTWQVQYRVAPEGIVLSWPLSEDRYPVEIYRTTGTTRAMSSPSGNGVASWWQAPIAVVEQSSVWIDRDVRDGETYQYALRLQITRTAHLWWATASRMVGPVTYVDRFPPPAPTDLTGTEVNGTLVLMWSPVQARDLAGYHVYMRTTSSVWQRLTSSPHPLTRWEFTLSSEKHRFPVEFRITAVDNKGNESPPGPVWVWTPARTTTNR